MLFVQAEDGLFYINPQLNGPTWYLQCDDDGCEVHVKVYPKTNPDSARRRAQKLMRSRGLFVKVTEHLGPSKSIFPNSATLVDSIGFIVQLRKPIPVPDKFDEVVTMPVLEHPFIAWKMEFHRSALESIRNEKDRMNPLLVKFLIGEVVMKGTDRRQVLKKLNKIYPDTPTEERVILEV